MSTAWFWGTLVLSAALVVVCLWMVYHRGIFAAFGIVFLAAFLECVGILAFRLPGDWWWIPVVTLFLGAAIPLVLFFWAMGELVKEENARLKAGD